MSQEEEKKETGSISRRKFLKDAGLIVGGATIGSIALVNACNGGSTTTVTGPGATSTVTRTVTTSVGAGATVTVPTTVTATTTRTVTAPPTTVNVPTGAAGSFTLKINGETQVVKAEPYWPLSYVLRNVLGLIGTKVGCDRGECGTCTVLLGGKTGKAVYACCIPVAEAESMDIVTIEGLASGPTLSKIQQTFLDTQTFQCGYCTPGQILAATALLTEVPKPTLQQAQEGMSGNLCFCGDYTRILNAVLKAAA